MLLFARQVGGLLPTSNVSFQILQEHDVLNENCCMYILDIEMIFYAIMYLRVAIYYTTIQQYYLLYTLTMWLFRCFFVVLHFSLKVIFALIRIIDWLTNEAIICSRMFFFLLLLFYNRMYQFVINIMNRPHDDNQYS